MSVPEDTDEYSDLDPKDWTVLRTLGHEMLDDMFDFLKGIREQPVWKPMPQEGREELKRSLEVTGASPEEAYEMFNRLIRPFATGNTHPGFMGWVHGGGNPIGMLAELLAAGLNCNVGGRDHAAVEVERAVIRWMAQQLGFPLEASGVLVTGSSSANLLAALVARTAALGPDVRRTGLSGRRLTAYSSTAAHACVARAIDFCGLGSEALRLVACNARGEIDIVELEQTIAQDRASGFEPFLIIGTAASVDVGAFDDLEEIGRLAKKEGIWFHVDAAFGAFAVFSQKFCHLIKGVSLADSVAFDFHKFGQVPYDCGGLIVRNPAIHIATFGQQVAYLSKVDRGIASNHPWFCDLGMDLSRGFRALKVWMTIKVYGEAKLGAVVENCCSVATHMAHRIGSDERLELIAPPAFNIVCFRIKGVGDRETREIVADVQEAGVAVPSTTIINDRVVIRAAVVNHRASYRDGERLVEAVIAAAERRALL